MTKPLIRHLMNSVLFFVVLIFQATVIHGQQIVMLYGSGSAGKSTLSREIVNLNQNWCYIDEDEVFRTTVLEHFSHHFPKEYKLVAEVLSPENIFQAIKNNIIVFPEDSTCSQQESVKNAIGSIHNVIAEGNTQEYRRKMSQQFQNSVIDLIREKTKSNESIILDRWYTTPETLYKAFPNIFIKKVLIFTTLEDTLANLKKRNDRAMQTRNSFSYRLYKHCLPSFIYLYKLSEEATNALYCYQRSELENIFSEVRELLSIEIPKSKQAFLLNDLSKEALDKLKNEFIPKHSHNTLLFLSPIDQYDFIINMQNKSPQKAALEFLNSLMFTCPIKRKETL